MILSIIALLLGFCLAVAVHEAGHIVTYKYFTGRWPHMKLSKGTIMIYGSGLKNAQERRYFVANGILFGLAALIVLSNFINPFFVFALLIGYVFGCRDDFKALERLRYES